MTKIKLSSLLSKENFIAPPLDQSVISTVKANTTSSTASIMGSLGQYLIPVGTLVVLAGLFYQFSGSPAVEDMGQPISGDVQIQTDVELDNGTLAESNKQYNVSVPGGEQYQGDGLLYVVMEFINRFLGIIGLVCLIMLIRAGILMITAGGNKQKFKKGFTIVKQTIFGLIFIGVSWILLKLIFWFITYITYTNSI